MRGAWPGTEESKHMPAQTIPLVPADSHDVIEVRGARENNLANVSLDLPKRS